MNLPGVISGNRKRHFIRLVVNGFVQAGLAVGTGLLIRQAFDRFITSPAQGAEELSLIITGGLILAVLFTALMKLQEKVDSEKMGQDYVHKIRMRLFRHMSRIAPRSLNKKSRGSIVLRFVGDLNSLRRWVSLGIAKITVAGVMTVGVLAALFTINTVIATGVSLVILAGMLYALLLGKSIRQAVQESRKRRTYLAANVNEKVSTMAVVQAFDQTRREQKRLSRQSARLKEAMVEKSRKIGLMRAVTHCAVALASGICVMLGAVEVAAGRATPGTVVAAITIAGLLVPAISDMGRVYEYLQEARIASSKIVQFLNVSSLVREKKNAPDLADGPGRLEFRNVSLGRTLKGISVIAEEGTKVAIVGPNGSGKSTLLSLAARLVDADRGRIVINGHNIRQCSLSSLRRSIGIVSPDLPLLRGSINSNITYRWPEAPEDEIRRVSTLCGVDEMRNELGENGDARITERGENLSHGQRQIISLARSLLGNPSILLLDEADSHLDAESMVLFDRLLTFYKGTILYVSHNLQRVLNADMVWKMEKGEIIETGSPEKIVGSYTDKSRSFSMN